MDERRVSAAPHAARMKKACRGAEMDALLREIQRYLAYVDAFRKAETRRRPTADRKGGNER